MIQQVIMAPMVLGLRGPGLTDADKALVVAGQGYSQQAQIAAATSMGASVETGQREMGVHNIFDASRITIDAFISNTAAGDTVTVTAAQANSGLYLSAPAMCKPGGNLTFLGKLGQAGQGIQFFTDTACTASAGFVDGPIAAGTTVPVPAAALAWRATGRNDYTVPGDQMVVHGPTLPPEYLPFGDPSQLTSVRQAATLDGLLVDRRWNLFRRANTRFGFLDATTTPPGIFKEAADWATVDVEVQPGETLTESHDPGSNVCYQWLTSDRRVIQTIAGTGARGDATVIAGGRPLVAPPRANVLSYCLPAKYLPGNPNGILPAQLLRAGTTLDHPWVAEPAQLSDIRQHRGVFTMLQGNSFTTPGWPFAMAGDLGLTMDVVGRGGRTAVDIMKRWTQTSATTGTETALAAADLAPVRLLIIMFGANESPAGIPAGSVDDSPATFDPNTGAPAGYVAGTTSFASLLVGGVKRFQELKAAAVAANLPGVTPNMTIVLVTPMQRFDSDGVNPAGPASWPRARMQAYRGVVADSAALLAVPCCDLYATSGINPFNYASLMDAGGIHPLDFARHVQAPVEAFLQTLPAAGY